MYSFMAVMDRSIIFSISLLPVHRQRSFWSFCLLLDLCFKISRRRCVFDLRKDDSTGLQRSTTFWLYRVVWAEWRGFILDCFAQCWTGERLVMGYPALSWKSGGEAWARSKGGVGLHLWKPRTITSKILSIVAPERMLNEVNHQKRQNCVKSFKRY